MSDPSKLTSLEIEAEIHRVCSLLGTIAQQYPKDSAESLAIQDAAFAFQHGSTATKQGFEPRIDTN